MLLTRLEVSIVKVQFILMASLVFFQSCKQDKELMCRMYSGVEQCFLRLGVSIVAVTFLLMVSVIFYDLQTSFVLCPNS